MIRSVTKSDVAALATLFEYTIADAFSKEGYAVETPEISAEIQKELSNKLTAVSRHLAEEDAKWRYLVAEEEGAVIGAIAFGPVGDMTRRFVGADFHSEGELGSMYVHPLFQGKGVSKALIEALVSQLKGSGVRLVSFDSGYKAAQKKWQRKFGDPYMVVPNYWDEGTDHMIWLVDIEGR